MSSANPQTPPGRAKSIGVAAHKVNHWIGTGELPAINIATDSASGRPRYIITDEAWEEFLAKRSTSPPPKRKRRSRPQSEVPQYV